MERRQPVGRLGDGGAFAAHRDPEAPAVIEPGRFVEDDHGERDPSSPELVYVPARPLADGAQSADLVVYDVEDSRVLLLFSDLDKLVAFCGDEQPWVSLPAEQVDALAEHAGADGLALDLDWNALVDELVEDEA